MKYATTTMRQNEIKDRQNKLTAAAPRDELTRDPNGILSNN